MLVLLALDSLQKAVQQAVELSLRVEVSSPLRLVQQLSHANGIA